MSAWFPVALQILTLAAIIGLAINGLGLGARMAAAELLTLRKTNLTTLVVWGLWWPGMIAVALVFGRAWCLVCPMELVNRIGYALGRRIGWPRPRLGRFLRAGWIIVVAYIVLQTLVAGYSIHRVPHYTSIFLIVLLGGALLTGLLYRDERSFCRAFCPAGALLSVYGRYTPVQLDVRDRSVCDNCLTKDCVSPENRDRFDKRSCPSLLAPFKRNPSDGCVLCLQCAKVCPQANMGLGLVDPESSVRRKGLLRPYEAAFVMAALGFVTHTVLAEVKWLDDWFHIVPEALNRLRPSVAFGWFEALWFLFIFPLLAWALIAGVGYLMGYRGDGWTLLLAVATGAAPAVAVAHLAKSAAKVASWAGFLPLSLRDPRGIETFGQIAEHTLPAPARLLGLSMVGIAMLALTLVMAWRAWKWARQVPLESMVAAKAGLVGATALFSTVLTVWIWPSA